MIIISACLCGVNCKYNGNNNLNENCLKLFKEGKAILICPEQLGGLNTPRIPSEIIGTAEEVFKNKGKVVDKEGNDVTKEFVKGAKEALSIAKLVNAKKAILKDGSPSCGCNYVYDGNFTGNKVVGKGLTAYLFESNGIEVETEY